jgi:NAD(P)H-flavin reductase
MFSRLYGTSAPVGEYETVLMVASGFGITAQLPYLKQLIYREDRKTRSRRIYLVWQLDTLGNFQFVRSVPQLTQKDIATFFQDTLNNALATDSENHVSFSLY